MSAYRIARPVAAITALAALSLLLPTSATHAFDPSALWNIVHEKCVPNQQQHGDPAPCVAVDLKGGVEHGYVVLKDNNGPSQHLLLPTARIVGIEGPALQAPDATNYFAAAWDARRFVEKSLGHDLPVDRVGLAVNSILARTQNQLHIHIDCIRPDVRAALARLKSSIGTSWTALAEPLNSHSYQAMRVMGATLDGHDPFKLLADGVPGAGASMKTRTLVVAGMLFDGDKPGFVILTDHIDPLRLDFAAGARLEDHTCAAGP
jgi:CDP-diacylglycerol pyrophosphatase